MANITIRIDDKTKNEADLIFSEMGLSMSGAINLFIKQSILERALPFKPRAKTTKEKYNEYFNPVNMSRLEKSLNNAKNNNFMVKDFDGFLDDEKDVAEIIYTPDNVPF